MQIYKTLVVSTKHIDKASLALLDPNWASNTIGLPTHILGSAIAELADRVRYGWRVYCVIDGKYEDLRKELLALGFGRTFVDLLELANTQGCIFLEFDRDAEPLSGFETYDWD